MVVEVAEQLIGAIRTVPVQLPATARSVLVSMSDDGGPDVGEGAHVVKAQAVHHPDGLSMHGGAGLPLPPTQGDVCQGPRQPVHQGVHKTSLSTTGLPLAELVRNVVVELVLTKLVLRRELVLLELVWLELILLELILLKLVLLELVLWAEAGLKLLLSSLQWELLDKLLPTVQELLPAGQDLLSVLKELLPSPGQLGGRCLNKRTVWLQLGLYELVGVVL